MPSKLALQIAQRHCETIQTVGALRLASNVDTELAEVREVLDGLIEFSDQVIEAFEITPLPARRLCLESARALYEKLRTDK
jgi:hypothetical protein